MNVLYFTNMTKVFSNVYLIMQNFFQIKYKSDCGRGRIRNVGEHSTINLNQ